MVILSNHTEKKIDCVLTSCSAYRTNFLRVFGNIFKQFFGGENKDIEGLIETHSDEAISKLVKKAEAEGYKAISDIQLKPVIHRIGGDEHIILHAQANCYREYNGGDK